MSEVDWNVWEQEFSPSIDDYDDGDASTALGIALIIGTMVWGSIILYWRVPVVREAIKITWSLIGFFLITGIAYVAISEFLRLRHPSILDQLRKDGLI